MSDLYSVSKRTFTRITLLLFALLLFIVAAELIGFIPESTSGGKPGSYAAR